MLTAKARTYCSLALISRKAGRLGQRDPASLVLTSWHFLHKDLDETILADGTEVLHDVPVLQPLVQGDLLVEGLRIPWRQTGSARFAKATDGINRYSHSEHLQVTVWEGSGQTISTMWSQEPWGSTAAASLPNPFPLRAYMENHIRMGKWTKANNKNHVSFSFIRAVFLWDFLDGDSHLIAQVPACVDHAVRSFAQNHLVAILVGLVDVLQRIKKLWKEKLCLWEEKRRSFFFLLWT